MLRTCVGIIIIMVGIVWYSMLSIKPEATPTAAAVVEPLLGKSGVVYQR